MKRILSIYGGWTRRGASSALAGQTFCELLREFGKLAPWAGADGSVPPTEEWADSAEAKAIVDLADRTCAHRFDLLGSGDVHLGEEIDWHMDFRFFGIFSASDLELNPAFRR